MAYLVTYDGNMGAVAVPGVRQSNASIYSGYAITGSRSIHLADDAYMYMTYPGGPNDPATSMWLYLTHQAWSNSSYFMVRFRLATGEYVGVQWNGENKTFDLYIDGTKVTDGTVFLSSQSLFNLRMYGTIADAGTIIVKINGETSITYNGDTKPGASDVVERLDIWQQAIGLSNHAHSYLSSISLNDGGTDPGDRRAQVLMPNGDSAVQWTRSAGAANYETVDEVPPSDADYNETATTGHKDLLTLADFDGTDRAIAGVTAFTRAWKTTADTQSLRHGVKANVTEDFTESSLDTSALYYLHSMGLNPDDAAAWEDADIDALLALYEAVIP